MSNQSVETFLRFVMSQVLRICKRFSAFFIFLYFCMYMNSNIEALIGLIVLQTCLCHEKLLEVNVFRLCFAFLLF